MLTSCSSSDKTQYVDTCWKRRSTSLLVGLSFSLATATTLVSSPAEAAEDVQATTSKSAAPESELVRELLRRTEENKVSLSSTKCCHCMQDATVALMKVFRNW